MATIEANLLERGYNPEEEERVPVQFEAVTIGSERPSRGVDDATLIIPENNIFAVLDGSPCLQGDSAVSITVSTLRKHLWLGASTKNSETTKESFNKAFQAIHQSLISNSTQESKKQTTLTLAKLLKDQGKVSLVVAHVGDSRAYVLKKEGIFEAITLDQYHHDALIDYNSELENQKRLSNTIDPSELSPDDQLKYKRRTQNSLALGSKRFTQNAVAVYEVVINPGDRVVLMTDGVSDNLTDDEMKEVLHRKKNSRRAAEELIKQAQIRSRIINDKSRG